MLEGAPEAKAVQLTEKYNNRVCALSPASVEFLSKFGAWNEILTMRAQPVKRMQVWEACSESMITFDRDSMDGTLAYIVENNVILEGINRQISHCGDSVEIRYKTKAKGYELSTQTEENPGYSLVKIHLDNGETIRTRLLIGADGFRSLVRETANINTIGYDYDHSAIVATLHLSEPCENNVAWQRFLPTGPIALLPLSDTLSSLVWSTTHEEAQALMKLPGDAFVDEINKAYWHESEKNNLAVTAGQILGQVLSALPVETRKSVKQLPPTIVDVDEETRATFPLGIKHSSNYAAPRLALIGDAAHRIHPLAGQGVNLGFGDAECLAEQISHAIYDGADIGALHYLQQYETIRQRHVIPVMATIDGLKRLYGTAFSPVVLLRSLGLQTTDSFPFIKDKIMELAMHGIRS
ncbi:ubiquinone biosynthesis monooxygenase COQ6, mitochondrial-like isoform X2 [Lineus longissimus]